MSFGTERTGCVPVFFRFQNWWSRCDRFASQSLSVQFIGDIPETLPDIRSIVSDAWPTQGAFEVLYHVHAYEEVPLWTRLDDSVVQPGPGNLSVVIFQSAWWDWKAKSHEFRTCPYSAWWLLSPERSADTVERKWPSLDRQSLLFEFHQFLRQGCHLTSWSSQFQQNCSHVDSSRARTHDLRDRDGGVSRLSWRVLAVLEGLSVGSWIKGIVDMTSSQFFPSQRHSNFFVYGQSDDFLLKD